jgi:hypothetical protein
MSAWTWRAWAPHPRNHSPSARAQVGVWEIGTALNELQRSILSAVEARRRLSGLDDLMTYFKDQAAPPPSCQGPCTLGRLVRTMHVPDHKPYTVYGL